MRLTRSQLATMLARGAARVDETTIRVDDELPKARSKFGAIAEIVAGKRFASKTEATRFKELMLMQRAGDVRRVHRQVIFDLPGSTQHRVDFLIVFADGSMRYEDAKGHDTQDGRMKRRMVFDLYGVAIHLWPERAARHAKRRRR